MVLTVFLSIGFYSQACLTYLFIHSNKIYEAIILYRPVISYDNGM